MIDEWMHPVISSAMSPIEYMLSTSTYNALLLSAAVFYVLVLMFIIVCFSTEREICETLGSVTQLSENRSLQIPGKEHKRTN